MLQFLNCFLRAVHVYDGFAMCRRQICYYLLVIYYYYYYLLIIYKFNFAILKLKPLIALGEVASNFSSLLKLLTIS